MRKSEYLHRTESALSKLHQNNRSLRSFVIQGECNCQNCIRERKYITKTTHFAELINVVYGFTGNLPRELRILNKDIQRSKGRWLNSIGCGDPDRASSEYNQTFQHITNRLGKIPSKNRAFCDECGVAVNKTMARQHKIGNKKVYLCKNCADYYTNCGDCGRIGHINQISLRRYIFKMSKSTIRDGDGEYKWRTSVKKENLCYSCISKRELKRCRHCDNLVPKELIAKREEVESSTTEPPQIYPRRGLRSSSSVSSSDSVWHRPRSRPISGIIEQLREDQEVSFTAGFNPEEPAFSFVASLLEKIHEDAVDLLSQNMVTDQQFIDDNVEIPYRRHSHDLCLKCYDTMYRECPKCHKSGYYGGFKKLNFTDGHAPVTSAFAKRHKLPSTPVCDKCYHSHKIMHDYHYKPQPAFTFEPEIENGNNKEYGLWFGTELEFNTKNPRSDSWLSQRGPLIVQCKALFAEGLMYAKFDRSVETGFELVTMPYSWAWYKANKINFRNLIALIEDRGFTAGEGSNAGCHIHLSRAAFTTLHLYKFCHFIYKPSVRNFIWAVSGRRDINSNTYTQFLDSDCKNLKRIAKDKRMVSRERHAAISMEQHGTVELRIFTGTHTPEDFFKNMEFAQSVYKFTRDYSHKDITVTKYLEYITTKPNRQQYAELLWYLLNDSVFIVNHPQAVAKYDYLKKYLIKRGDK